MAALGVRVRRQNEAGPLIGNMVALTLFYPATMGSQAVIVRLDQAAIASDLLQWVPQFVVAEEGRDA